MIPVRTGVEMNEGILDLADGRTLGFGTYGPDHAPPIIYCHGYPANRLEFSLLQPVLERRGVDARVVVLDRPGYGKSSFQAKRNLLDWPKDVEAAVDQLGLGAFSVVGVSGGGPYALACAYSLADRVKRVGVAVGVAPREATGMETAACIDGPSSIPLLRRIQFSMAAMAFKKGQEDRFVEQTIKTMSEIDGKTLGEPEVRQWFLDMTREAFTQGGAAAAHEGGLYRKSWGFDPSQIKVATDLWYGELDKTVPASAGRWLADRMPVADIKIWPHHGHLSWMVADEAAEFITRAIG